MRKEIKLFFLLTLILGLMACGNLQKNNSEISVPLETPIHSIESIVPRIDLSTSSGLSSQAVYMYHVSAEPSANWQLTQSGNISSWTLKSINVNLLVSENLLTQTPLKPAVVFVYRYTIGEGWRQVVKLSSNTMWGWDTSSFWNPEQHDITYYLPLNYKKVIDFDAPRHKDSIYYVWAWIWDGQWVGRGWLASNWVRVY